LASKELLEVLSVVYKMSKMQDIDRSKVASFWRTYFLEVKLRNRTSNQHV